MHLFQQIRAALEREFGNIGNQKTVMLDFEIAALNAVELVFPEWDVKTCFFHFVKNVTDQAKKKKIPKLIQKNTLYVVWVNQLFGKFFIAWLKAYFQVPSFYQLKPLVEFLNIYLTTFHFATQI